MKNILLLAHDDHGQEARLRVALDLAKALDAHLTCLDVTIVPDLVTDYVAVGGGALLLADEERSESRNRARLRARLEEEGVSFDWIDATGDLSDCFRTAIGLVDLVIVNRDLDTAQFPDMLALVGDLVVEEKVTVLAVPESAKGFRTDGKALVAWDGSPDSQAALKAAVPLLRLAGSVTLFHVDDGSIQLPIEQAARYLSHHGIDAAIRRETVLMDRPGTVLMAEARAGRADYLVMGGYGRSRFMETLFGGATRRMLTESPVPVLLAHRA